MESKIAKAYDNAVIWFKLITALMYSSWRILMALAGACIIGYEAVSFSPNYENPASSTSHYLIYAIGIGLIISPMLTVFMAILYVAILIAWGAAIIYGTAYVGKNFGGAGALIALLLLIGAPIILIGLVEKLTAIRKNIKTSKIYSDSDQK